jgi:hypothetical protein
VASPLSGAAVVEVDVGVGVALLGRIGKEVTSMELVGVGGGDELGGRDGRLGGDETGITMELFGEVVEKVEEFAIVLEEEYVDGDGELGLNWIEDTGEGKVLELCGKAGTDDIEIGGKSELDGIEIGGKNELDWVVELEVWAEFDDIPELDNSIELDIATALDENAELDRRTELENATRLENDVVFDWRTELDVGNGLVDNAEPDTSIELGEKAELEAGTVLEYSAELGAAIKLEE